MTELERERLKRAFAEHLPLAAGMEPHLRAALERVLENPGSLIRPEIVLKVAAAFGVSTKRSTNLAIALEYFHTASLLFDDLPSMDDAIERRGLRCVHVDFGQASAMLAALALINRAYFLAWEAVAECDRECRMRALGFLERYLGVGGLLNGQSMDLHYGDHSQNLKSTEAVAIGKTVSLIRLTLVLPALLGGASSNELRLLDRLAFYWGLSYQIVDDLKDVLQSSAESGKTVSRDLALNRPNLALMLGVQGATERLQRMIKIGNSLARRLISIRPAMYFLDDLRTELEIEALRMIEDNCICGVGGSA